MKAKLRGSSPSVAIVYDRLNSSGGAEKILAEFQHLYPQAPFYSSVCDRRSAPWLSPKTRVHTSWLQYVPGAANRHQLFGWLMPILFESFDFSQYDIVISVSSESAKGVLTQPKQLHINYTLTPTRYLWSHADEYQKHIPKWLRPLMKKIVNILKRWDRVAAQRPDIMVPISQVVKDRIAQYYQRESTEPIYPPISLAEVIEVPDRVESLPEEFFFTWGRHVRYKQFDTVIRAAAQVKMPVVIAGSGPDTKRLQQLALALDPAGNYIFFVGMVSDAELRWYLEHARASVFPQIEDFGIVLMEALLAGCPVIAHKKSGAVELMTAQDGLFLEKISIQILADTMKKMRSKAWNRLDIRRRAGQYAGVRFSQEWSRFVEESWEKHQKSLH